jgi:hypothetical protein
LVANKALKSPLVANKALKSPLVANKALKSPLVANKALKSHLVASVNKLKNHLEYGYPPARACEAGESKASCGRFRPFQIANLIRRAPTGLKKILSGLSVLCTVDNANGLLKIFIYFKNNLWINYKFINL